MVYATYPRCSKVLILNPKVGDIVSISSPLNLFKIVVFPALSNPLLIKRKQKKPEYLSHVFKFRLELAISTYSIKILISFSFCFIFFNTVKKPISVNVLYRFSHCSNKDLMYIYPKLIITINKLNKRQISNLFYHISEQLAPSSLLPLNH